MEKITESLETAGPDAEFLRAAGITPDLSPGLSTAWKAVFLVALLAAAATTVGAGVVLSGTPTEGEDLDSCVTQCPM